MQAYYLCTTKADERLKTWSTYENTRAYDLIGKLLCTCFYYLLRFDRMAD